MQKMTLNHIETLNTSVFSPKTQQQHENIFSKIQIFQNLRKSFFKDFKFNKSAFFADFHGPPTAGIYIYI